KWGAPEYLDMSTAADLALGSVGMAARNIVCQYDLATPLVTKKQLATMNFTSLSTSVDGSAELYYKPIQGALNTKTQKEVIIIAMMNKDMPSKNIILPSYRKEADLVTIGCDTGTYATIKSEYYDASDKLIF